MLEQTKIYLKMLCKGMSRINLLKPRPMSQFDFCYIKHALPHI